MSSKQKILTSTTNLSHDDWLMYRRRGIGGSDAATVAGINPWQSAIAVYRDKIGEGSPIQETERMRIGRDLEDYVARRFSEETGQKVRRRNAILQHPKHEWMLANIDRELIGKPEGLECKVTSSYGRGTWNEGIPPYYELQCHHYMAVTGWKAWWIAVLIGNEKIDIKRIERDEEIINNLIQIEQSFWENHVVPRIMPPPDGSNSASLMIKQMYPESNGELVELSSEYQSSIERIQEIDELQKTLKTEQDRLKQEIQLEMGEAERARIGERFIKWSTVRSNRLDSRSLKNDHPEIAAQYSQESVSRRFTIQ